MFSYSVLWVYGLWCQTVSKASLPSHPTLVFPQLGTKVFLLERKSDDTSLKAATRKLMSLADIISKHKDINTVWGHESFNPGQTPAALRAKRRYAFVSDATKHPEAASILEDVKKAVAKQPEFEFKWIVEVKEKRIQPVGLALVVKKLSFP